MDLSRASAGEAELIMNSRTLAGELLSLSSEVEKLLAQSDEVKTDEERTELLRGVEQCRKRLNALREGRNPC